MSGYDDMIRGRVNHARAEEAAKQRRYQELRDFIPGTVRPLEFINDVHARELLRTFLTKTAHVPPPAVLVRQNDGVWINERSLNRPRRRATRIGAWGFGAYDRRASHPPMGVSFSLMVDGNIALWLEPTTSVPRYYTASNLQYHVYGVNHPQTPFTGSEAAECIAAHCLQLGIDW